MKAKSKERLERYREANKIARTGKGSDGTEYNTLGKLNQAAWLGEVVGSMLDEYEVLWQVADAAKRFGMAKDSPAAVKLHAALDKLESLP